MTKDRPSVIAVNYQGPLALPHLEAYEYLLTTPGDRHVARLLGYTVDGRQIIYPFKHDFDFQMATTHSCLWAEN